MSKLKIVGIRHNEFDYGENHFKGRNIYFINDDGQTELGATTGKMFLNDNRFGSLNIKVGDILNVFYNRFGKPDTIYKDETE